MEKRKKRKEAWDAHEERKLGQVSSGSRGGPGWRHRNQGKAEAPVEAVDWCDISKSMVRKKLGFVGIKKLNGNGEKEGASWAVQGIFGSWWVSAGEVADNSISSNTDVEPSLVKLCEKSKRKEREGNGGERRPRL
ncbi:unnamed protein product [Amaranthus hypochondriacus]